MDDTICAISTSLGVGAISIVRMSGKDSLNIINKIFKGHKLTKDLDRTINYGYIYNDDEIIDEVLVNIMVGPKSYTCEDVIEINCHGGIATTKKVLGLLLDNGCRLAEPGEFTKRAFLNGRIDLTQSEAVNDLLKATNDKERKLAMNAVNGLLFSKISEIRKTLGDLLSNIEVNIDFPEYEDNLIITEEIIDEKINIILDELKDLLNNSLKNKVVTTGINIALIGSPNVGKSSLLNAFLDEDKAIVTDIAGTTRDIIEGKCKIEDITINFIDTAGIRETDDIVEKIGVEKSQKAIQAADLVIFILDNNRRLNKEEQDLLDNLNMDKTIVFINKNDTEQLIEIEKNIDVIYGNTKSLDGIIELKKEIIKRFELDKIEINENSIISNVRQEKLMKESIQKLEEVLKNNHNIPIDMLTIDINAAWNLLGEITGESYHDELLDILFKNFCLGK